MLSDRAQRGHRAIDAASPTPPALPERFRSAVDCSTFGFETREGVVPGSPPKVFTCILRDGLAVLAVDGRGNPLVDPRELRQLRISPYVKPREGSGPNHVSIVRIGYDSRMEDRNYYHLEHHRSLEVILFRDRIAGIVDTFCEPSQKGVKERQILLYENGDLLRPGGLPNAHLTAAWCGACVARGWPRAAVEATVAELAADPPKAAWLMQSRVERAPQGADEATWKDCVRRAFARDPSLGA